MKLLETSGNLQPSEVYKLTMSKESQKMKDCVGQIVEIKAYALYEDTKTEADGTEKLENILSIMTPEGDVLGTNSPTFARDFFDMIELFESLGSRVNAITVIEGESKKGRTFVTCEWAR